MQIASDAENRDERFKPEGGTPTLDPPPKTAYLTWCPPKPSSHSQREEWHSGEDVSCQGDSYRFLISSRPEDRNRDAMDLFSSVKIILPYEYYVKYGGRWPLVRPMVVRDHKRRTGRKRWIHVPAAAFAAFADRASRASGAWISRGREGPQMASVDWWRRMPSIPCQWWLMVIPGGLYY